jgi:hypothetical protein
MTERKIKWNLHSYTFNPQGGAFHEKKRTEFEELEEQNYDSQMMRLEPDGKILDTPFGLFILDDDLNPYKQFEFWVGHTNFDITQEVKDIIMTTPGVEVFELVSRYRFIIGVGQLFAFHDVRASLQEQLCGTSVDIANIAARVENLKREFTEAEYTDYAIYVFPNGQIDFCWLDKDQKNLEDFQSKKQLLADAQTLSKGQLYLYEPREPATQTE